jgi:hypothetical protein
MKRVKIAATAALVGAGCYFGYNSLKPAHEFTSTEMENIEALALNEVSTVEVQCSTSSVVYCMALCRHCGTLYRSTNEYGITVGVRGQCVCGSTNLAAY